MEVARFLGCDDYLKYAAIKQEVLQAIRDMMPNDRIPSRTHMCAKFHISRTTADKIIDELRREGVLYCVKGSGTFVSKMKESEEQKVEAAHHHWAIILPDVSYNEYPQAFGGIERFCREKNIDFSISNTNEDADTEFAQIQRMVASGVNGLIIVPAITNTENKRNYLYLSKMHIPFVFWQRSVDYLMDVPQVLLNGYYGGYIATKHLIDKGYKRIAFLSPKRFRSSMDRYMGYCAALSETNMCLDPELVRIGLPNNNAKEVILEMLAYEDRPDAFVCYVDSLAIDVAQCLYSKDLRISDDVGIICFEGTVSRLDSSPDFKLSYVDINRSESGYAAATALWNEMNGKQIDSLLQICIPSLKIYDSCKGKTHSN